ncbi:hypothetical protein TB147_17640 [Klebsiella aerogenes]|uniref:hypothetical protein n=1 Tax=Klebsiella aerogenes TaxID=548 RepID=UPI002E37E11B|nr:hypothetical protein [Klebsiella aerogenes]MED7793128.1 hypothetical protein [Klebsiella aerogenes]
MQTDNSQYTQLIQSQAIALIGETAIQICRNGVEISHESLRERLCEQLAFARHTADPELEAVLRMALDILSLNSSRHPGRYHEH